MSFSEVVWGRYYDPEPGSGATPVPPRVPRSTVVDHGTGLSRARVVQFADDQAMNRHSRYTRGLMRQATRDVHNLANIEMLTGGKAAAAGPAPASAGPRNS